MPQGWLYHCESSTSDDRALCYLEINVLIVVANSIGNSISFHKYLLNAHRMLIALEATSQKGMKPLSTLCNLAR